MEATGRCQGRSKVLRKRAEGLLLRWGCGPPVGTVGICLRAWEEGARSWAGTSNRVSRDERLGGELVISVPHTWVPSSHETLYIMPAGV